MCMCIYACLLACLLGLTTYRKFEMISSKCFSKIDWRAFLMIEPGDEANCVRVQHRQPVTKMTEVVLLPTINGRVLTGSTNLILTVVEIASGKGHAKTALVNTRNLPQHFSVKLTTCMYSHISCPGWKNGWHMQARRRQIWNGPAILYGAKRAHNTHAPSSANYYICSQITFYTVLNLLPLNPKQFGCTRQLHLWTFLFSCRNCYSKFDHSKILSRR